MADHSYQEGSELLPERRAVLVGSTLYNSRPRRYLGLYELDRLCRRLLRPYRRSEVAPAVHNAVVIG